MILLGVDIGGTKIAAGVVDGDTGAVLHCERTPTQAHEGGVAVLARAITLARTVVDAVNVPIDAAGIGAGGQIDYRTGVVLSATDILPGWAGVRLTEAFAAAFGVSAFADNDVNAFALGEHRFGAGRGATDAVYLALGTGVGGAIVTRGELHRGKRGTGGELGHMQMFWDSSAAADTLESLTCGTALADTYNEAARSFNARNHKPVVSAKSAIEVGGAAQQGDAAALSAVRTLGESLGVGLASLANILDTERFVIGGGLLGLGDLLLNPARETFAQYVLPLYRDTVIVAAGLGRDSAVVGAACVALADLERAPMERNTIV